jgi:hypothetical protein
MHPELYIQPKPKRRPRLLRPHIGRAALYFLAFIFIWHFVLYGFMRLRYDPSVKINPITDVVRVPYTIEGTSGRISGDDPVVITGSARQILEGAFQEKARRYLDVYAILIPWKVELELE